MNASPGAPSFARLTVTMLLLWLLGIALRITILAVPPVLPTIHADLQMSATQVGILSGIPLVVFALVAVPGALLIARFGMMACLVVGMLVMVAGSGLRAVAPEVLTLFAATVIMGAGIAVMQPALPVLVNIWVPTRVGFGTAVYTNGMIIGGTLAASLTSTVVLPAVGGQWRLDLAVWTVPPLLILPLVLLLAPKSEARKTAGAAASPMRWWPDWRSSVTWRLGLLFGANTSIFYATNAFLPEFLSHTGRAALIGDALTALNGTQLIGSFLLLAIAPMIERKAWPFVVFGIGTLLAMIAMVYADGYWVVVAAALQAFTLAISFVLSLALPALVSPRDDVHRTAAGMFTISYLFSVFVPVACGLAWDLTGNVASAFIPIDVCAVIIALLAPGPRLFAAAKAPG